jgi:hypothetical protein
MLKVDILSIYWQCNSDTFHPVGELDTARVTSTLAISLTPSLKAVETSSSGLIWKTSLINTSG